ncbi:MAG: ectonucleotide pyrophosphatase/phosphodiesterase [Acidobacteriota bacterium]
MHAVPFRTCLIAAWLVFALALPAAHAQAPSGHTVVLISLDGLGWDAPVRDGAAHLLALGKRGVWAPAGILPSYPALNAPNLYTIVTGLYPGQHGIVGEAFYDPTRKESYSADDPQSASEGAWYAGTPLWSLAESRGVRTACLGWTGCAAEIAGHRPTYTAPAETKPEAAVHQIMNWLRLPAERRPRFIAARLAEPAQAARRFGPDAPQTRAAVRAIDAVLGGLMADLSSAALPIDLVVVSDHGFAETNGGWITLDQYTSLAGFTSTGTFLYAQSESDRAHAYNLLKRATSEFVAYRLKDLPADLHLKPNERAGDPVIVATGAYAIRTRAPKAGDADGAAARGVDGFDPQIVPEMKAIFFAAGPDIVKGKTVAPFESVHLYPWLAHLLGLNPAKSDGNLNILSGTLRDDGN